MKNLFILAVALLLAACHQTPLYRGDALLQKHQAFRFSQSGQSAESIDTSLVYYMTIVKCPDCSNGLRVMRYVSSSDCHPDKDCSRINDDFVVQDSFGVLVKKSTPRSAESTHFLKFIDSKRVIYGSVNKDHLPKTIDLTQNSNRILKKAKMARGYYAVEKGQVYLRMQHLRTRKVFDMVLKIEDIDPKKLRLTELITYDAADAGINSDGFQKTFRVNTLFSYSMIFSGMAHPHIPVEHFSPACAGNSGDCATW